MVDPDIDAVAMAAGVHRSTVSRAFFRPKAVNPKTREHILRVADELGSTMSPLARALRSKASAFVPLIVADIVNPFCAELATSMIQTADERGYQLVVCTNNGDNTRTAGYLVAMQSLYAPFGIIAPSTPVDLETLTQYGFGSKVVILDHVAPGAELPSIAVDIRLGMDLAFEHLRSLGHQRIGYVSGIHGAYTVQERLSAYEDWAGGNPIVLDNGSDRGAGERAAARFVKMKQRPTAIIAANDMTAFALISTLAEQGRGCSRRRLGHRFRRTGFRSSLQPHAHHDPTTDCRPRQFRHRPGGEEGGRRLRRTHRARARAARPGIHGWTADMTGHSHTGMRVLGVQHVDHVAFTVPDLDTAAHCFVQAFGAEELYRSERGLPDAEFMPRNFAVPPDAKLRLAMSPMPPNLNLELFEWSSSDRRLERPRHSDAGGQHLCFSVADVDAAIDVLGHWPGVRVLGARKKVAGDRPRVAGSPWTYFLTPWGLLVELVDRSRVAGPPAFVGPADWRAHEEDHLTKRDR